MIVTVPAPGVIVASDGSTAAASAARSEIFASAKKKKKAKKKPALIRTTTVNAAQAGPVTVTIRPTKAGKKILRKKGRLKAKVKFVFTPTGGLPATQFKTVTIKAAVKKKN